MSDDKLELKDVNNAISSVQTSFEEFQKTNDERLAEIEAKGAADPLLDEKLEKIGADMLEGQKALEDLALEMKRKDFKGEEIDTEALDQKALDWANDIPRKSKRPIGEFTNETMIAYKSAVEKKLSGEESYMTDLELKALSVGSDPDGGFFVHPDMSGAIVQRIFDTSAMRSYANIETTTSDTKVGLHDTDEAGVGWGNETTAPSDTSTPQITEWSIPVHTLWAMPKATQQVLDDAPNTEAWLSGKVADRFGRAESTAFVTGDGVDRPRGFLTYADRASAETYEIGAIRQFDTGVNGDFAADPAGTDVLTNMVYGLQTAYRANSNWFMNRKTMGQVALLKDSDGRNLWQPTLIAGQPSMLMGYGVAEFDDMPDMATNSLSVAFGDMKSAYTIVDRMGIRVIRDPYTNKPHILFYSTKRVGGDVVDFAALNVAKFAA